MHLKSGFLGVALLAGTAAAASAQSGWPGFYVGLNAGYAFGTSNVTTSTIAGDYFAQSSVDAINADGQHKFSPSGFTGGATVGWNISHSKTLFGLEGDFSSLGFSESRSVTTVYPCCSPSTYTIDQSIKTDWLATVRLRLGIQKPKTLWYITGGAAFASMKMDEAFTDTYGPSDQAGSHSETRTGWTAGAGWEKAMGDAGRWSLKIEYLYADLGTMSFTGGTLNVDGDPDTTAPFSNTMKLTTNVVRAGFNYHFGH